MCALAARYSHIYNQKRDNATPAAEELTDARSAMETWSSKAKEQVNRQLAVANLDLVEALLMISWYEFGADRDGVSFWFVVARMLLMVDLPCCLPGTMDVSIAEVNVVD